MIQFSANPPDLMPNLSPGRHRSPRRGACFMEFASYLAGEKWNDHPKCTHPLLAEVARLVNDFTSDEGRSRLVGLIPRVIDLSNDDPYLNLRVVVHAASAAIPIASLERQRAIAVGLVSCAQLVGPTDEELAQEIDAALGSVPDSERWAKEFISSDQLTAERNLLKRGSAAMIRLSLLGIAFACVPDADDRLYILLERLIEDFELAQAVPVEPARVFAMA